MIHGKPCLDLGCFLQFLFQRAVSVGYFCKISSQEWIAFVSDNSIDELEWFWNQSGSLGEGTKIRDRWSQGFLSWKKAWQQVEVKSFGVEVHGLGDFMQVSVGIKANKVGGDSGSFSPAFHGSLHQDLFVRESSFHYPQPVSRYIHRS